VSGSGADIPACWGCTHSCAPDNDDNNNVFVFVFAVVVVALPSSSSFFPSSTAGVRGGEGWGSWG
jgi:hypothetical protein